MVQLVSAIFSGMSSFHITAISFSMINSRYYYTKLEFYMNIMLAIMLSPDLRSFSDELLIRAGRPSVSWCGPVGLSGRLLGEWGGQRCGAGRWAAGHP